MRTDIPSALQTHLETRATTLCWCWRIDRRDGVTMGFTNHDRDLSFADPIDTDPITYEAGTGFLGSEIESQLGMNVDDMDVYGAVDSTNISEADIKAGRYDNADISVYLVNWQDTTQLVKMKSGNIGNIKRGQTLFEAEVRGLSHTLQEVQGRLYNYKCDAQLGDGRCSKDITGSTFTGSGTVVTTDGSSRIVASGLGGYSSGWFTRGKLTFTSGSNNGLTREIKVHSNSSSIVSISLWESFPWTIAVSDTFSIVAGCEKTFATCKAKFDNATNFRGFPHIPGPSTTASYISTGDPNLDGGGNFLGKD